MMYDILAGLSFIQYYLFYFKGNIILKVKCSHLKIYAIFHNWLDYSLTLFYNYEFSMMCDIENDVY